MKKLYLLKMISEIGKINIEDSFTVYTSIVDGQEKWCKLFNVKTSTAFSFPSGITGYRLVHVPSTAPPILNSCFTPPVSFIEFTTDSNPSSWVTEDPDWYNNKKLVGQMKINRVEEHGEEDCFNIYDYVKYQACLWKKLKKLGVVVERPVLDEDEKVTPGAPDHSYVFIGKDLARLKKKWINSLTAVQISPSVYKLMVPFGRSKAVLGYIIYWTGQYLGFDPRGWHSDSGYYDQYMINVGDNYIFGGDQEYYYWRDYVNKNEKVDDSKNFKVKSSSHVMR